MPVYSKGHEESPDLTAYGMYDQRSSVAVTDDTRVFGDVGHQGVSWAQLPGFSGPGEMAVDSIPNDTISSFYTL
jgi:hypothetical protein